MESLITAVHILVAIAIVGLILLQQGKGAEMGASFGSGGSQTLFGSAGSGNFLSHTTAILVTVFFVTSFTLSLMAKHRSEISAQNGIPSAEVIKAHNEAAAKTEEAPAANSDVPVTQPAVNAAEKQGDVPAAPAK